MGMFSPNRTTLGSVIDVVANESYVGAAGAYRAMCEGFQNSYAIFEKCIELDFMEAAVVNEGVSETEFAVIQENFVTDFFAKIKDFLVKLMEKIKGVVKSFIDKVVGTFTKDGKTLVNKYKSQILKKDLSKMKYKYAKPRPGKEIKISDGIDEYKSSQKLIFDNFTTTWKASLDSLKVQYDADIAFQGHAINKNTDDKILEDINEKINDNTYLEKALGRSIGASSIEMSDYAKEVKEYLFEDEEKEDENASSLITEIMTVLTQTKQQVKDLEKNERDTNKDINEIIKHIDRVQKEVLSEMPDKDDAANNKMYSRINKYLNTASRLNSQLSTYVTKAYAVSIEMKKFHFAQCKRIWVQMASYNPKSVKEDAMLIEAIGEAAEYEAYSSFTEAEMN